MREGDPGSGEDVQVPSLRRAGVQGDAAGVRSGARRGAGSRRPLSAAGTRSTVKPEVVKVVSPTARLSDWEKERRQEIERNLDRDTVVEMVASQPELLSACSPASKNKG
ncbi:MAG: hypothetical protein R2742_08440 [Micropruina glycogenica]